MYKLNGKNDVKTAQMHKCLHAQISYFNKTYYQNMPNIKSQVLKNI